MAPIATANRFLEEALRQELFPVTVVDTQGHGPDPGTEEWRQSETHQRRNACRAAGPLRYAYNSIDLSGDRQDELVATVIGPYACGTGGCNAYVFKSGPKQKGLRLVSQMSLFKPPLVVSDQRHNGWRDLISRVRIDAGHGYYTRLPYNGRSYPSNPSVPPAEPLRRPVSGVALLDTNDDTSSTHPLPCDRPAIAAALSSVLLSGTEWQLVAIQSMDDAQGITRPADPSRYSLRLQSDGRATLRLDCNTATGTWSVQPSADGSSGSFRFGPLAATGALCPPPSLGERLAAQAPFVRTFLVKDGRLHLSLLADAGILVWERKQPR
ncbi:META domain-containing protein [Cyanobium sp. BSA11S]|uniref:META domain-containing protein n=1 Tax=Cyanobium sp. BSA11S TaxID=3108224 RepID=UPI003D81A1AE